MDLNKHLDFFNPLDKIKDEIHIIGCGALGSYTAQQLAKLGVQKLHLWDFDIVEEHNVTNQLYISEDLGKPKTMALDEHLEAINPNIITIHHDKYEGEMLKGIIFLTVDSIEVRHLFYTMNQYNTAVKVVIDERIALTSGQVHVTDWKNQEDIENIIQLSDFKDEEVVSEVSACGTTLSVSPSVLLTISYGISSMINFLNKGKTQKFITFDAFSFITRAQ